MSYPRVEIDIDKIIRNTKRILDICSEKNIKVVGVTKVFCGLPEIAEALLAGGIGMLADARIENIKKLKDLDVPKMLLRLPELDEIEDVVEYTDISLNSQLETIIAISRVAEKRGKKHKVILMVDLGDLREGIFDEDEVYKYAEEITKLGGVELFGLGTNLTCYGGVIPSKENLGRLSDIAVNIEKKLGIKLSMIAGGNSSSLHLLEKKEMPERINLLRIGEAIVLGRETAYGNRIDGTYDDCFKLIAEIIEIKAKPSVPIGDCGMDCFGLKPTFVDRGIRKRALCAIGRQDVDLDQIMPEDPGIIIIGGSSDHLIIDITDSAGNYIVGSKVTFNLTYSSILRIMTSEYVAKVIKKVIN